MKNTWMNTLLAALLGLSGTACGQVVAAGNSAQAPDVAMKTLVLGPGTKLIAKLTQTLSTKTAKPGDPVIAEVVENVESGGKVVIPRQTKMMGHVTEVRKGRKDQQEFQLGCIFDRIQLEGGQPVGFTGATISVGNPPDWKPDFPSDALHVEPDGAQGFVASFDREIELEPGRRVFFYGRALALEIRLTRAIDVRTAKPGDEITAEAQNDLMLQEAVFVKKGARLTGHVIKAEARNGRDSSALLGVIFDKVQMEKGQEAGFSALIARMLSVTGLRGFEYYWSLGGNAAVLNSTWPGFPGLHVVNVSPSVATSELTMASSDSDIVLDPGDRMMLVFIPPASGGPAFSRKPATVAVEDGPLTLAPGTTLLAILTSPLNAERARPGDQVTAKLVESVHSNGTIIARDSKLIGHVTVVQASGKDRPEFQLGFIFDQIQVKGTGQVVKFTGLVQGVAATHSPRYERPFSTPGFQGHRLAACGFDNLGSGWSDPQGTFMASKKNIKLDFVYLALRVAVADGPSDLLQVQLLQTIDARTARTGDEITAVVTRDMMFKGEKVLAKGATVSGHVTMAMVRGRNSVNGLGLTLDKVQLADGQEVFLLEVIARKFPGIGTEGPHLIWSLYSDHGELRGSSLFSFLSVLAPNGEAVVEKGWKMGLNFIALPWIPLNINDQDWMSTASVRGGCD